jgi:hypothetical protein
MVAFSRHAESGSKEAMHAEEKRNAALRLSVKVGCWLHGISLLFEIWPGLVDPHTNALTWAFRVRGSHNGFWEQAIYTEESARWEIYLSPKEIKCNPSMGLGTPLNTIEDEDAG